MATNSVNDYKLVNPDNMNIKEMLWFHNNGFEVTFIIDDRPHRKGDYVKMNEVYIDNVLWSKALMKTIETFQKYKLEYAEMMKMADNDDNERLNRLNAKYHGQD